MWSIRFSDEFLEINRNGVWFVEDDDGGPLELMSIIRHFCYMGR